MNSDCMLKSVVKKFDTITVQSDDAASTHYNSDENCRAILYVCIEGSSAMSNEFAIMTVNKDFFSFYVLTMFARPPFQPKHIIYKKILLYNDITKLKARKFLLWRHIKMHVDENGNECKLKLMISAKTKGIEAQNENLILLMDFLKNF
ncbi:MAG: hypothetical protein LBD23_02690 [Oscillospiraceae bacterium]|nr:hypothetical protein [Oscillospiraceae bacterium]